MTKQETKTVIKTMAFMASVIKSGEPFTDIVDDRYCEAMNILKNNRK